MAPEDGLGMCREGVTASIHKLTAGSGYDYLTRQVAVLDATDKGHVGLASYYTERGETPGVWMGSGMADVEGVTAGDMVTAEQMQSLFGLGHHPLAGERVAELDSRIGRPDVPTPTEADYKAATRLGAPFKVYRNDVSSFRIEVARRMEAHNVERGVPRDHPVAAEDRARIRTTVATELFAEEFGRAPADARELAGLIAKHSRQKTMAVAGYDLTFSPVKSVSVLWAVADPATAATIERAHHAAVADALSWLESNALFSRQGTNGVRQVDVRGLVATAFVHRDSRAGDPDLHTHVAIANKVRTLGLDGNPKWLAIDGRVLFKAMVSISETYNSALEQRLTASLGVRFAERDQQDPRKRPVREIVGVDPELSSQFSKRRAAVEGRRDLLTAQFQADHGRPPTPVETLRLAQQATLETRAAKHSPRTLAEQRSAWRSEAITVLGSASGVEQMVHAALRPGPEIDKQQRLVGTAAWVSQTADAITHTMESQRSTWQYWHVYAEAQRRVRALGEPAASARRLVDQLVERVLDDAVTLARPTDGVVEPAAQRRVNGDSVYSVAGSTLYTSARVVAAENRLVHAAGLKGGRVVASGTVDVALLESVANGKPLNPGQVTLVKQMATSGARLQMAIAPAGAGKTTAMRVLTRAWSEDGGTVLGLAPQASAASVLGDEIGGRADTLAMLAGATRAGSLPAWAQEIGEKTLVVIDEAGMADTVTLDTVVSWLLARGASIRLIGDDQQLAAIGAGGVLRDIKTIHGALHLSELMRFRDPSEGAATLALRDGRTDALGFYLDQGRVHVGDIATMTDDVFTAWFADRTNGLDSLMLAPTRELVADLNQRARDARLATESGGQASDCVRLADGNLASRGDVIITRSNNRSLRTTTTDWVKNGDRWTVLQVHDRDRHGNRDVTVAHLRHGHAVRLPARYLQSHTGLGYAATIHSAQGATAETTHCLLTGSESRQLLYTGLSRGAIANHLYLDVVGDGDPHSVVQPSMVHPQTGVDVLESILAHDETPRSATTETRELHSPTRRLGESADRYVDALHTAAEATLGRDTLAALDTHVDDIVTDLTAQPAWPTLRSHLIVLGAEGLDPLDVVRDAVEIGPLDKVADKAAVLEWRIADRGLGQSDQGPLPWLPGIPTEVKDHPEWGPYLRARATLVDRLARQVRHDAAASPVPSWAESSSVQANPDLLADIAVWRAATGVVPDDRRPTGGPAPSQPAARWQSRLNRRLATQHAPALDEWHALLHDIDPHMAATDPFVATLASRLAAISRAGVASPAKLVQTVALAGPLPDDHAAAALWWRLSRHLAPAVAAQVDQTPLTAEWIPDLTTVLGPDTAGRVQASSWWPALVSNLDRAVARGWALSDALNLDVPLPPDLDPCEALVWRTTLALDPMPPADHASAGPELLDPLEHDATNVEDHDLTWRPHPDDVGLAQLHELPDTWHMVEPPIDEIDEHRGVFDVGHSLSLVGLDRSLRPPLPPSDRMLLNAAERDAQGRDARVNRGRLLAVNQTALEFFEANFSRSWSRTYLQERLHVDLAGHPDYRPGHAPHGWTRVVSHLRNRGFSDDEMLAAGIATRARTGRLIDRFRDRLVLPIQRHGEIVGFIGRRHPDLSEDDNQGPKYLNTPTTVLFSKGEVLYGLITELLDEGATPVLVEGPLDAIAVTLASAGRYLGVAPLGTALTEEQADQLARLDRDPIVATDPDDAGQAAAERDYWMLTPHGLNPGYTALPHRLDPADLHRVHGPAALTAALDAHHPLGTHLLQDRLDNLPLQHAAPSAVRVLAAAPSEAWEPGLELLTTRLRVGQHHAREALLQAINTWDADPRSIARTEIAGRRDLLLLRESLDPTHRWEELANRLDPRLVSHHDWPATAALLQQAYEHGLDPANLAEPLRSAPLHHAEPGADLRDRIRDQLTHTPHQDVSSATMDARSSREAAWYRGPSGSWPTRPR